MIRYFLARGLKEWFGYRTAFILGIFNQLVTVTWGYYLSTVVTLPADSPYDSYFSFLLLGIVFQRFLHVSIYNYVQVVRQEQTQGTLEISLFQAAQPWKVIVYQGLVGYAKTALLTSAAIVWGIFLGGVFVVNSATVVSGLVVTLAAALAMLGFGLMAAGVVMVTKQGDPVTFTIETLNYLFTGLYYPLSVLPRWLQAVGKVFPLTHALDASRRVFLSGESLAAPGVSHSLAVLAAFAVISIPVGIATFTWGCQKARRDGTLTFF